MRLLSCSPLISARDVLRLLCTWSPGFHCNFFPEVLLPGWMPLLGNLLMAPTDATKLGLPLPNMVKRCVAARRGVMRCWQGVMRRRHLLELLLLSRL